MLEGIYAPALGDFSNNKNDLVMFWSFFHKHHRLGYNRVIYVSNMQQNMMFFDRNGKKGTGWVLPKALREWTMKLNKWTLLK